MVLSNAERQARFQQRLRERAAVGVTPEMVAKATRLSFEAWVEGEGASEKDPPSWEKLLAKARKPRLAGQWQQFVPADPDDDYTEFGTDARLMRAVARVAASVLRPPKV